MSELYRLKSISNDEHGLPFTMCMKHLKEYKLPDGVIIQKLGSSDAPCVYCKDQEPTREGDE